jgi:O-antigen/teichoic acid export membrane protein
VSSVSIGGAFRLLFGRVTFEDHRKRRVLNIIQSVVTSLGNKGVSVLVTFLSVPLTIRYLGPEQYGAWVTIGSLLAWLSLTDFGLGNGLTNAVTTAVGEDRPDLARMHVSNGIFLLTVIAGMTGLVLLVAWPFIDWAALFGIRSAAARAEIGPAMAAALTIFLLQFPLGVAAKVYLAYQEGRIGNYWATAGNILSLVVLLIVTRTHGGLIWLVVALSGTSLLVNLANNLWVFVLHRPIVSPRLRHVELGAMRSLGQVGGKFFLIQIMALVVFQTDNLVVGHFLGSAKVPEYSLTYALFNYTSLPQAALFSYLWAAYTEAIARKDIAWVSRTFRLNLALGMAFTLVAVLVITFVAKPFIAWWAGPTVVPSTALIIWMAAWSLINAFTNPIACLLASAAHLRAQIVYGALSTASNIVLSIYLVQRWGVEGVIAATVIAYAIFVCGPTYVDSQRLLGRLRHAV